MQESAYRHVNNLINLYGPIKVTQESFWRRVRRAECRVTTANELSCEGRISETRLEKSERALSIASLNVSRIQTLSPLTYSSMAIQEAMH